MVFMRPKFQQFTRTVCNIDSVNNQWRNIIRLLGPILVLKIDYGYASLVGLISVQLQINSKSNTVLYSKLQTKENQYNNIRKISVQLPMLQ